MKSILRELVGIIVATTTAISVINSYQATV
jgi:hypothetical protein